MKKKWKRVAIVISLLASLLTPTASYHAMERSGVESAAVYSLTNTMQVSVKSVLNELQNEGTRIGIVLKMTNEGTRLSRVPDYDVRVLTEEGTEYTLRPSASNTVAIQPKETVELSYMIVIDRGDLFSLKELVWVEVDEFGYPRQEKTVLSVPIASMEWRGEIGTFSDPSLTLPWGESFTLSALSGHIEFKPVRVMEQNTAQGPTTIVELLAENKSDNSRAIPDFRMDARSDKRTYGGKRLEQEELSLGPGERKNVHYAFPAAKREELKSLTILSTESFGIDENTEVTYTVGRLAVQLPEGRTVASMLAAAPYEWNRPIRFDPLNKIVQPEVDVRLADLRMHESVGGGFQAVVAKFKLENRSGTPMPVPGFRAQIMTSDGKKYTGTRQSTVAESLIPNISYMLHYSFVVPSSEKGDKLMLELLDGSTATPYQLPVAELRTQVQPESDEELMSFYPYQVKLNSWGIEVYSGSAKESLPYTYKLKMDLDVTLQDDALIDQSFPKLKVKLVNREGRVIGSKTLPFTGENHLVSGMQTVNIPSMLFDFNYSLLIYETVETPFGETERLVKRMKY